MTREERLARAAMQLDVVCALVQARSRESLLNADVDLDLDWVAEVLVENERAQAVFKAEMLLKLAARIDFENGEFPQVEH
jgi:hypothetical protein